MTSLPWDLAGVNDMCGQALDLYTGAWSGFVTKPVVGGTTGYVQRFPAARVNPGGGGRGERLRVSRTQF